MLPTARGGAILLRKDCSLSCAMRCPTTHITNHKTACFLRPHCPWKHVRYKLSSLMPNVAFLDLFPANAMAKHKTMPKSGQSTVTSATSFSTVSCGVLSDDEHAFLSKLQGTPIHAPPGPCPLCTGARPVTKTQLNADRKSAKEAKAKLAEVKKIAATAKRADSIAKKQERQGALLSADKAKASKAVAKAEELGAAALISAEPVTPHLHKKSKGNAGTPSLSLGGSLIHQSSPQRKTSSDKKRVNVHSPYCVPVRLPESSGGQLWSDEGSCSSSSSGGILVVGEDTSDEDSEEDQEPLSLILTSC
jgi:hypothetical protein